MKVVSAAGISVLFGEIVVSVNIDVSLVFQQRERRFSIVVSFVIDVQCMVHPDVQLDRHSR